MASEIRVPALGESVVEATIARWLKQVGDTVETGDAIVELETEKVNIEVPAEAGGTITHIAHQEGETVRIGDVLATLDGEGTGRTQSSTPAQASTGTTEAKPEASGSAGAGQRRADDAGTGTGATQTREVLPAPAAPAGETPALPGRPVESTAQPNTTIASPPLESAAGTRDGVSPVAQRIAADHGIDPARVDGSGPGGRVMKNDVLGVLNGPTTQPTVQPIAPAPLPAPARLPAAAAAGDPRGEERVRLSRRRLTIARRLVEAQQTAAMLTTFNEVEMTNVMEVRKRRRDSFRERHGVGLGFMSFFTKACIGALKAFPNVNAELQGEELVLKHYYDVGVAVSTEEGLVVPVVRDADRKTFAEIEKEIASLATRARERKLTLEELRGGTFTITNGGIFGSLMSTPILNPPQVGILGMHTIKERPVVVDGQVVARPMMYLALSYDHRIVDGREAVSFLVRVKELIENPETLLLEG